MNEGPGCMGGGQCELREQCPMYVGRRTLRPAERVCERGADGRLPPHFVQLYPGLAMAVQALRPRRQVSA